MSQENVDKLKSNCKCGKPSVLAKQLYPTHEWEFYCEEHRPDRAEIDAKNKAWDDKLKEHGIEIEAKQ